MTGKKQDVKKTVTHDFTDVVNDAIKEHGTPFLKAVVKNAGGKLVQDFCYRPGKGFIKVGSVRINGRRRPCYRKGQMRLAGELMDHLNGLPKALRQEIDAVVLETTYASMTEEGQNSITLETLILQTFNNRLFEDINKAVVAAGHDEFAFEQEFINNAGYDDSVFVSVMYDGFMPSEERLDEIAASNKRKQHERMGDVAAGKTVDARGTADYAKP